MSVPGSPYLSIVVTSRNDDHGGSLLRRTQTFVNALAAQVNCYGLSAELIVVEWNPPHDRPPLREALRWPDTLGCLQVRFIEVPAAIHQRYHHADALPLYQMIGKNVGIRRACGEFVLATNIDILFSNELMAFLAARKLEPKCLYRIDRHDVMTDVPVDAGIDERLAYCENHLVRLNTREGTYYVTPQGWLDLAPRDIADPSAGIVLGRGWFPAENGNAECYRWVENDAAVTVFPRWNSPALIFEVEPGPSLGGNSFDLLFVDDNGAVLTAAKVSGRSLVKLQLPPTEGPLSFRLRTPQGGYPVRHNPRILNFRVFRCEWQSAGGKAPEAQHPSFEPPVDDTTRASAPERGATALDAITPRTVALHTAPAFEQTMQEARAPGLEIPPVSSSDTPGAQVLPNTSASSEFKSSSEPVSALHWVGRGVAKLGGVLRRAAEGGSVIAVSVPVPRVLRGFLRFCLRMENTAAAPDRKIAGAILLAEPAPVALANGKDPPGSAAGPATAAQPWSVAPGRVEEGPWARAPESKDASALAAHAATACQDGKSISVSSANQGAAETPAASEPPSPDSEPAAAAPPGSLTPAFLRLLHDPTSDYYHQPAPLHTNGCGDFTLMAKEHWLDLRAYPELDMYSFHIDSVFCFAAHHAGVHEVYLEDPMRIYHIEHGRGSGWSPDGETQLFDRLRSKGISWLEYVEVMTWAAQMRRFECPMIFNRSNWGLSEFELAETTLR